METFKIPEHAGFILDRLEAAGYEAWCVGGCVRDSLLGLPPADWDVSTNALPAEIEKCFQDCRVIETGVRHGTVTVLIGRDAVEVTTYRADGDYRDHRHPERVQFSSSLEDDLSRRDFTVNALAYHPDQGLKDPFGGIADLNRKLLRCVGDPERRFEEDALRILRCLRFSAVLGFSIEEKTGAALLKKRRLLTLISHERVREELSKLLCGQNAAEVLRSYPDVLFVVLPELAPMLHCAQENPYHRFTVWEHTLHALSAPPRVKELRWAVLLHDCGKPKAKFYGADGVAHFYAHEKESAAIAEGILDRLRFSKAEKEKILALVRRHGEIAPLSERRVKRLINELGKEGLFLLLDLMEADLKAQAEHLFAQRIGAIDQSRRTAEEILSREDCLNLKDLEINGRDLLDLGFSPGPKLGAALNTLLEQVLDGALENRRTVLLEQAKKFL